MISLGDALHAAFSERDWPPDERQAIDDCLDAAVEWSGGRLPLSEAVKIGVVADRDGIHVSSARTRCRAVLSTSGSDLRYTPLKRLLDRLVASQRHCELTNKGLFEKDELIYRGVTV